MMGRHDGRAAAFSSDLRFRTAEDAAALHQRFCGTIVGAPIGLSSSSELATRRCTEPLHHDHFW